MKLTGRARIYGQALTAISKAKGIGGSGATLNRGARFLSFGVRLHDPLQIDQALRLAEPLAVATSTPVVIAHRERGLILYQFQLAGAYWESYTRADLKTDRDHIGVGLAEGRRQINVNFDVPQLGVFGATGSGKTETVKSMLVGLFTAYSPDDLRVVIIDLKGKYTDFANVTHLGGMPIARTDEEINHAFAVVNAEIRHREENSIFDAQRMVIVIDEAEAIISTRARLQFGQVLVKRGREIRINGIFATQEPHKGVFSKYLMKQILGRWVGLVDGPNTSYHITGRAGLECHRLTGKGDFIHVKPGGLHDRLQVALATQDDFNRIPRGNNGAPPEFEDIEPLALDRLPDDDERGPGRPREEVDPLKVAYYLVQGPGRVSQRIANEELGLGYILHKRHQAFSDSLVTEIKRLLEARKNGR